MTVLPPASRIRSGRMEQMNNKFGRWLIGVALITNQLSWPMGALAQSLEGTPTQEPTPTQIPIPTETVDPTPEENLTPSETPTPTLTLTPIETAIPTETPTLTPTPTEIQTPTEPPIPTEIPTFTETPTSTPTETMAPLNGAMSVEPVSSNPADTIIVVVGQNNPDPGQQIKVDNSAQVSQTGQSTANSGDNQVVGTGTSQSAIVSGQAVALANLVNIVNTTTIGSTVKIYLLNNISGQVGEIDLSTAWNLLNNSAERVNILTVDTTGQNNGVNINNLGIIDNQLEVVANSGGNVIVGDGSNSIITGNSYALANVFNLLNINFINSRFFLGVINVDGSTFGDLILPNPESFMASSELAGNVGGVISNSAEINSLVKTTADSGNDEVTGGEVILVETGNATATTNLLTVANQNMIGYQQLLIGLNTLGNWSGNILNWEGPGIVTTGNGVGVFDLASLANNNQELMRLNINNIAYINNQILTKSISGNNSIISNQGESMIQTGNAWSMANITNMANLNVINSNWFYGMINVIGDWKGNVVFAYPDLTMSLELSKDKLEVGEETAIFVNYANIGYDNSGGNEVNVNLPDNLEYLGDDSGLEVTVRGGNLTWKFANISAKTNKRFTIRAKLIKKETVFRIVKPAMAQDSLADSQIVINGQVSTSKVEVSTNNNSAQAVIYTSTGALSSAENGSGDNNQNWPKLVITQQNNVNDWVYENDVVTFEINGKNEGEAAVYDSYLIQQVVDAEGNVLSRNRINVGKVEIGKSGKITFGLPISFDLTKDSKLYSECQWIGFRENGDRVESNMTESSFLVKYKGIVKSATIGEVKAVEISPEVLGEAEPACQLPKQNLIPHLLLLIMSAFWIQKQIKKWIKK